MKFQCCVLTSASAGAVGIEPIIMASWKSQAWKEGWVHKEQNFSSLKYIILDNDWMWHERKTYASRKVFWFVY